MHRRDSPRDPSPEPMDEQLTITRPTYVHLQDVISDSCNFYEQMEHSKEGSIERMLTNLRTKIDTGKVNVNKREQYDP